MSSKQQEDLYNVLSKYQQNLTNDPENALNSNTNLK
jgi:hypothetical protein